MADNEKNRTKIHQAFRADFMKYSLTVLTLMPTTTAYSSQAAYFNDMVDARAVASYTPAKQNDETPIKEDAFTSSQTTTNETDDDADFEHIRIGNWNSNQLVAGGVINQDYVRPAPQKLPDKPDDFIPRGKINTEEGGKSYLAATHDDGSITMTGLHEEKAKSTRNLESKRYLSGDPFARNALFYHEVNHSKDAIYLNYIGENHTPVNSARFSNLTESVAFSVSYLSTAHQYDILKKQGITTVQINGEEKPLDYILETYPKLKETYNKYGLDLSNPDNLKHYVELGVEYKNDAKKDYDKQFYSAFVRSRDFDKSKTFEERVNEAKTEDADYDKISHLMTSKVYIGHNTCVDLSSCYNTLNDMSKKDVYNLVERVSEGKDHVVPSENLVAINNHLNQQGISDSEKDDYLAMQFFAIAAKDDEADCKLKDLMLQSQAMCNDKHQAVIVYDDNSTETINKLPQANNSIALMTYHAHQGR